jgi:hypothetical protein
MITISKKKLAKLCNTKTPSDHYWQLISMASKELLRCGKYHFIKYPDQIKDLPERLHGTVNEVMLKLNDGKGVAVTETCYTVKGSFDDNYVNIDIYYNIL